MFIKYEGEKENFLFFILHYLLQKTVGVAKAHRFPA